MSHKQIIEQFFVPIKKIKKGDLIPVKPEPAKVTDSITSPKSPNPKVEEWMRKNKHHR